MLGRVHVVSRDSNNLETLLSLVESKRIVGELTKYLLISLCIILTHHNRV